MTPFQEKVYKAVLKIPYGQVRSYKWVAKAIGKPNASRAVGQALKNNPFVGIVPCHRVIASNGSIGGFSKGLKKKKAMLNKEGLATVNISLDSIGNYTRKILRPDWP